MKNGNGKINILLVDDNLANLLSLESILQGPDRNLVRASSGDDALNFLLDEDAAVILLDVRMPIIDGLETAALIRRRERTRKHPDHLLDRLRQRRRCAYQQGLFAGGGGLHHQAS